MASTVKAGREQRRSSPAGSLHKPDLAAFYRHKAAAINPGEFEFELSLLRSLRGGKHSELPLDQMVESFSWAEDSGQNNGAMTGQLQAHRPDPENPLTLPIMRGDLIRCRVRWGSDLRHRYELWTMRCDAPQIQVDTGVVSVNLADDLILLSADSHDWIFRKTKHRPHGYFADEIARRVAARLGLKVGHLERGSKRMSLTLRRSSGLDVLKRAYKNEKDTAGKTFIIRIRNGALEVVRLQRNPFVYVLSEQIQTAMITTKGGAKSPTTVLTGRGELGHGKHAKKISYTAFDRRVVRQLGYVHNTKNYGKVGSPAELRSKVKRDLAQRLRFNDTIEITHQGIPFIRLGDAERIHLPREGYSKEQQFAFVSSITHTVAAASYSMDAVFGVSDPYLAEWNAQQKAARARAAKRAKRSRARGKG